MASGWSSYIPSIFVFLWTHDTFDRAELDYEIMFRACSVLNACNVFSGGVPQSPVTQFVTSAAFAFIQQSRFDLQNDE